MNIVTHIKWFVMLHTLFIPCVLHAEDISLEEISHMLESPEYETRNTAVIKLFYTGKKRSLNKQEVELLLPYLKSDSDWRIKVKIAMTLPYASNPDWVIQPLIAALQDRNPENCGNGNVPAYASKSLALLGDTRALKPLREWLEYLESHPNVYPRSREQIIVYAKNDISELEEKLKKTDGKKRTQTEKEVETGKSKQGRS